MTDRDDVAAEIDALGRAATTPWVPRHNLDTMQAERDAARRERDRAVETRENANACSLRLEAERDAARNQLRYAVAVLAEVLDAAEELRQWVPTHFAARTAHDQVLERARVSLAALRASEPPQEEKR